MTTKLVLFDIGDVLFDETPQHSFLFHTLLLTLRAYGKDVRWDDFNATRKQLAAQGPNPEGAIKASLAWYCANDSETETLWHLARDKYQEFRRPRPFGLLLDGITPVLEDLKQDFRLGIVANQHPPVFGALADYGIEGLFDVIVISEIVHLFKPDPAIFEYALRETGTSGVEALFVGDRPDNDVAPAKSLGMKTVRFKRGIQYVHYNPTDPAMTPDAVVTDILELAAAVQQIAGGKEGV